MAALRSMSGRYKAREFGLPVTSRASQTSMFWWGLSYLPIGLLWAFVIQFGLPSWMASLVSVGALALLIGTEPVELGEIYREIAELKHEVSTLRSRGAAYSRINDLD